MSNQVAVSIEDNIVKVVYATFVKGRTVIQKTTVFKEDEFDSFLKTTKLPDLTVVYHFKIFYCDIIAAPPAKTSYLKKIIESEIRKRFPELLDFSYFYSILTDKTDGEKGTREIFFFAVHNSELNNIVERFNKHGKSVKYIYPDILALSYLIKSSDEWKDKTVLPLFISGTERALFLVRNGQICFIRCTPSSAQEVTDLDIDNINMTINYCRQKLRVNPESIILMNAVKKEGAVKTVIPIVPITYPAGILASEDTLKNFTAPIAAIIFGQKLKSESLLPLNYRILYVQRSIASYAIILFLTLSLIGMGQIFINLSQIPKMNEKITLLRKDLTGIDAVASAYEKDADAMQQLLPLINFVNEAHAGPDLKKALVSLKFLPMENVHIKTIQLNSKKDSLLIQVTGTITAKNYGDMHRVFIQLLNNFNSVSGMAVVSKNIELRSGNFQIDAENRT